AQRSISVAPGRSIEGAVLRAVRVSPAIRRQWVPQHKNAHELSPRIQRLLRGCSPRASLACRGAATDPRVSVAPARGAGGEGAAAPLRSESRHRTRADPDTQRGTTRRWEPRLASRRRAHSPALQVLWAGRANRRVRGAHAAPGRTPARAGRTHAVYSEACRRRVSR